MGNSGNKTCVGDLRAIAGFLLDFADSLMAAGTQTSRIVRNLERLADNFGCRADIIILPKTVIMTVTAGGHTLTRVKKFSPPLPDFTVLSELRILSWEAYRNKWSLAQCRRKFAEIKRGGRIDWRIVAAIVSVGNAAFCQLFGGFYSVPLIFFTTLAGFLTRRFLEHRGVGILMRTFAAAFVSSMLAGTGAWLFDFKTAIAISTSVLYLVPGVPLLNALIDIFDGHVLAGFSRLANASAIIFAMTVGLLVSLWFFGGTVL